MISLEIPVEKIPYVRTIEGRKFKAGKWEFPDSALPKLQQYGLVSSDIKVEESPFSNRQCFLPVFMSTIRTYLT